MELKKLINYMSWRWMLATAFICLFACSQPVFFETWSKYVSPVLMFSYGWPSIIMILLLLIVPAYQLVNRWRKYVYDSKSISLLIVFLVIYAHYRINMPEDFAIIYGWLAYSDLFWGIGLLYLAESLFNYFFPINNSNDNGNLWDDEPITKMADDKLNRKAFVQNVTEEVVRLNSTDCAQTFGIVASWGNGKTSFINMMKEQLKKEQAKKNIEVMDFCPWHLPDKTDLSERFFKLLSSRLWNYDKNLYKTVQRYAEWLVGKDKWGNLSKLNPYADTAPLSYGDVCKALKTCGRRYIVFIDDIDRLEGKEILEVFKLMRGSANFPNIVFVVAFDKEYVLEALQNVSSAMNESYIKKFFTTEYVLPTYPSEILMEIALQYTKSFMSEDDYDQFHAYIMPKHRFSGYDSTKVRDFVTNLRELKRWTNAIRMDYVSMKGEADVRDLSDINLLKLYYPKAFYAIREEGDIYLEEEGRRLVLYKKKEATNENDIYASLIEGHKRELLTAEEIIGDLEEIQKRRLKNLLERLFPNRYNRVSLKSACNAPYFKRYFYNTLQESDMSDDEFKRFRESSLSQMKKYVDDHISLKGDALRLQIENYQPIDDTEATKMLHIIFYAAKRCKDMYVDPDCMYALIKGLSMDNDMKRKLVHELFTENGSSHYVEYILNGIQRYYVRHDWEEYMSEEDMQTFRIDMLRFAVEENLDAQEVLKFYHATKLRNSNCPNEYEHDKRALDILKTAYISRPLVFLPNSIWSDSSPDEETKVWYPSVLIEKMWGGDWDEFESFLSACPEDDMTTEFLNFYNLWKDNKRQPVAYLFSRSLNIAKMLSVSRLSLRDTW